MFRRCSYSRNGSGDLIVIKRRQNLQNITGQMTYHNFERIRYTDRRKQSANHTKLPVKHVSREKQHTFSPSQTLHVAQIYSIHRYRMGCKEHG